MNIDEAVKLITNHFGRPSTGTDANFVKELILSLLGSSTEEEGE